MNFLGEDMIPTLFFFALVFYMWEIFLSVFQSKQAHESSLWRQTLPVCVLYEGRWNLLEGICLELCLGVHGQELEA